MARTYTQLLNFAKRALDDSSEESDITQDIIVNDAGTHLFSMHPWRFRKGPPVTLSLLSGQAYVEMPDDFGEPDSIALNGLTQDFRWTTTQEIANLRDHSFTPVGFIYWGALVHQRQLARELRPPPPRIEIYPTPASDEADVLQIWYRGNWVQMREALEISNTPDYVDPLLHVIIQAFASGYLDRAERGNVDAMLENIAKGPIARAAMRTDKMQQPEVGPLQGGAVQMLRKPQLHYLDGRPLPSTVS